MGNEGVAARHYKKKCIIWLSFYVNIFYIHQWIYQVGHIGNTHCWNNLLKGYKVKKQRKIQPNRFTHIYTKFYMWSYVIKGLSNRLAYLFDETGIPIVTRKSFSLDYIRYVLQVKNTFHYIGTSLSKYQTHISIWMAHNTVTDINGSISLKVYTAKSIWRHD